LGGERGKGQWEGGGSFEIGFWSWGSGEGFRRERVFLKSGGIFWGGGFLGGGNGIFLCFFIELAGGTGEGLIRRGGGGGGEKVLAGRGV
jgi:hypothetical protein